MRVVRTSGWSGPSTRTIVGQQLPEQLQRGRGIAVLASPSGDVGAGGQSVGVVRAQHPDLVGQQLPEQLQRGRGIATLTGPAGDVGAGGQRRWGGQGPAPGP